MCIANNFCVLFWKKASLAKSRVFRITTGVSGILWLFALRIILEGFKTPELLRRKRYGDLRGIFYYYH